MTDMGTNVSQTYDDVSWLAIIFFRKPSQFISQIIITTFRTFSAAKKILYIDLHVDGAGFRI